MHTTTPSTEPVRLWPDAPAGAGKVPAGQAPEHTPASRHRLLPFPLAGGGPHAAVVVCPGGGYHNRAAHEGAPVARWLNTLGVAAFELEYRVAPHRYPCALEDARRAIRLVRARAHDWNVDPRRVGILGFSAGGHVAISAATLFEPGRADDPDPVQRQDSRPDALIACYPVVTFGEHGHQGSAQNLLGQPPDPALKEYLSLENRVTAQTPPTFIWHTASDGAVPVENALLLAGALRQHRVPFALHVFPHGRHGLGMAEGDPVVGQWTALCAQWLAAIGFR